MDAQVNQGGQGNMGENQGGQEQQPEHPKVLINGTPNFLLQNYTYVMAFIQAYGWFVIIGIIVLYYLKQRFTPKYESYRRKKEEQDYLNVDPNVARQRIEGMESARRRLQEKYDAQTALHAEEVKKRDEEKRKAKIEDWERHQRGEGYRSKIYKPQAPTAGGATGESSTGSSSSQPGKPKKTVYRNNDYNPLTGTSGASDSCGWRPGRRGGGGGGG